MNELNSGECFCGSGRSFSECCGPFLSGRAHAPTAEALMRSRYSAFATGNAAYLEATLLPENRPGLYKESISRRENASVWVKLEILSVSKGLQDDATGIVEFVAHYCQNGKNLQQHERSKFVRKEGLWFYTDGILFPMSARAAKTGRNDLCSCGSGLKYKNCCGR